MNSISKFQLKRLRVEKCLAIKGGHNDDCGDETGGGVMLIKTERFLGRERNIYFSYTSDSTEGGATVFNEGAMSAGDWTWAL